MVERLIASWRHAASIGSRLRRRPQTGSTTSRPSRLFRCLCLRREERPAALSNLGTDGSTAFRTPRLTGARWV